MTRKQAAKRRIGKATKALGARLARRPLAAVAAVLVLVGAFRPARADDRIALWRDGQTACRLVPPSGDERAARLAQSTINDFTRRAFNVEIGPVAELTEAGAYIVLGMPKNNPTLAALVNKGL